MIQRTLTLISLVFISPFNLAWAEDWPQWRGPDRTGVAKEKGLLPSWPAKGPKLLWIFRDAGIGYSSMSVVGDRLYSMGGDGNKDYVYAVDLKNQKRLWSTEVGPFYARGGCDGPRCTPTIDGSLLYAIGGLGNLVCVETATGKKVWAHDLQAKLGGKMPLHGYCESPLVDGDQMVVTPGGKADGAIAAFDKKTGKLKWRTATTSTEIGETPEGIWTAQTYASMIAVELGGIRQYVQNIDNFEEVRDSLMVGVRAADGKLLWKLASPTSDPGAVNTPIYHNGCVYLSNPDGCRSIKFVAEGDQFKAEKIYANKEMRNSFHSVVLVGQHLYGYSSKGRGGWMCQDFKTGKTLWHHNPKLGLGSIISADGNLYCYHEDKGDVLLIKATPESYQEQGRFRIPEETKLSRGFSRIWAHPIVANGKLYLRDLDLIFCYDVRKPSP